MAAAHTAPEIGSRIIAEHIAQRLIGSTLKTGGIQADKMIGGQLSRVVTFGAE
jgi:hypothetical protein